MAKAKTPQSDLDFIYRPKSPAQKDAEEIWRRSRIMFFIGPAGTGKAQPLSSTVWTPEGPVTMGDIRLGQLVCTPDGTTAPVVGIYPQGVQPVYEIEFDNGDKIRCTQDHLWKLGCTSWGMDERVLTLDQMMSKGVHSPKGRRKWFISPPKPLHFTPQPVTIEPYALGLLLGDGSFRRSPVVFTTADTEMLAGLLAIIPPGYSLKKKGLYDYRISAGNRGGEKNPLTEQIKDLGLWGLLSNDKFIPHQYKYNSYEVRLAVLQGLFDTDGSVIRSSRRPTEAGFAVEYCSTSKRLAEDVREVAESLGCVVYLVKKRTTCRYKGELVVGEAYRVSISLPSGIEPFRLARKRDSYRGRLTPRKRWIHSVTLVGEEECQCIAVDDPNHLYVTDHCVPTHNTTAALGMALREALATTGKEEHNRKKLWLARPHVACGEEIGFSPGSVEEKLGVWLNSFRDCFGALSADKWAKLEKVVEIEPIGVGMLRGRSLRNGTLIVDEGQLLSYQQLVCICTRLGENSRIVITGDPDQSDRYDAKSSPLMEVAKRLDKLDQVALLRFPASGQLRDPLLTDILDLL